MARFNLRLRQLGVLEQNFGRMQRQSCTRVNSSFQVRPLQTQAASEPRKKLKEFSEIPGPKSYPVIGSLLSVLFNKGD